MMNARAKIPIAMNSAGFASEIVALAASPIRYPTNIFSMSSSILCKFEFLSILFLVALGVAFFSGIRATEPDMQLSVDRQYDDLNFMDIRVTSTQGLTEKDLLELKAIEGVEEAEASYTKDVLCDIGESEKAIKV